jgi:hypothetical protein
MAATHTTYLKMKIPAPNGPITVVGNYKVSLDTASAGSNLAESLVIAKKRGGFKQILCSRSHRS